MGSPTANGARKRPPPRWRSGAYIVGRAFGLGMRLVPARHRFSLAARMAGSMAVPMRGTRLFSGLRALRLNSERDLSLHLLLRCMTASGTAFDVPLRLEGEEILEAALSSGRGTVIVAPHALLSRLLLRHLYDRGHWPTIIGGMNGIPLAGTRVVMPTVHPASNVLLLARTRLRQGGIVCAMVDRLGSKGTGKNMVTFPSPVGDVHLSDSIFRLAVRCNAQVIFTLARAEPGGTRQWISAPRSGSAGSPEAIAADFVAFLREHTAYLG
ncbi:hypothetical protein SAMN05216486_10155 [bacterium JGI 053]|nr:hypothetical protein SAMN05216486_10155 [bacterium JGI 053]